MSFKDSVQTVLTQKYATFGGRARRSELWWFALFAFLVTLVAAIVDVVLNSYLVEAVVFLALLVPYLAVGARRLHDTGRSGWWQLIGFVPLVGTIVLIVFWVQEGQPGSNAYGANPKGEAPFANPTPSAAGWGQPQQ